MQGRPLYKGRGCETCRQTGFKGRMGLYEIIVSSPELREMIARRANVTQIRDFATKKQGMRTMLQDGYEKIFAGVTTPREVFNAVYSSMSVE